MLSVEADKTNHVNHVNHMNHGNSNNQSSVPLFHSFYTKRPTDVARVSTAFDPWHHQSVDNQRSGPLLESNTNKDLSNPDRGMLDPTMEGIPGHQIGGIMEPRWGQDTDYVFYMDPLPKLSPVEAESNARVLAKMLRQKLIHKIKLLTGREPRLRSAGGHYLDPLKSDPAAPYFYEWRFTPEYPGFPLRPLGNWLLPQVKDCNMALEKGDLYLVDVRNPRPRPSPNRQLLATINVTDSVDPPKRNQNRKRLVNILEHALSHYILARTGITSFDSRLVLTGDGAAALPGWRWVFPDTGVLTRFPYQTNFWSWSSDEILHALQALVVKTLRLERVSAEQVGEDEVRALQEASSGFRRLEANPADAYPQSPPVHIDGDESSTAENQLVAELNAVNNTKPDIPPVEYAPAVIHHLDDLVRQLAIRSQEWKSDWTELQEARQKIQELHATTSQQASRIEALEKAVRNIEQLGPAMNATKETFESLHPTISTPETTRVMEASHDREITELKEQNEELQDIIKNQEEDVQNAVYLQERNRVLEQQLAEKAAEAASAYETLAALAGASSSKSGGTSLSGLINPQLRSVPLALSSDQSRPPNWMASYKVRCDRCRTKNQVCLNPGGPCDRCQKAGDKCTFTLQKYHNAREVPEAVAKARQATDAASQFLQQKPVYKSPYLNKQEPYGQNQDVTRGLYSSQPPLQSLYGSVPSMSSGTSQSMNAGVKRIGEVTASHVPSSGSTYSSPYSVNSVK